MCAKINDPNAINQSTLRQGKLPLHFAASSLTITTKDQIKSSTSYYEIELSRWNNDGDGDSGSTTTYSSSSLQSDGHSKRNVCSHSIIQYLLELNKDATKAWTKCAQLPLHLACAYAKSWKDIQSILQAAPNTISCQDGPSQLYSFMLAAVDEYNTLDVVYQLLLFNPELVSQSRANALINRKRKKIRNTY